jgi:hypothetical protein
VALPELELDEPDVIPELVPPDDAVVVEPEEVLAAVVAAAVLAAAAARAGSLPVASCTKIPPEVAKNVVAAIAATRRRICETRRFRARRRSATRPEAAGRVSGRAGGRRAAGNGSAWVEASGGVIVYLVVMFERNVMTTASLRLIATLCDAHKRSI